MGLPPNLRLITNVGPPGSLQKFPPLSQGEKAVLRIVLPLPPKELNPNIARRTHWAVKGRKVGRYRAEADFLTQDAIREQGPRGIPWKAATVRVTFYFRDRRRRDRDNLLASLKAGFDGIADAGVVVNDSEFTYRPVVVEVDAKNPRVLVVIEET